MLRNADDRERWARCEKAKVVVLPRSSYDSVRRDGIKEVRCIRSDLESELSSNVALLRACRASADYRMGAGL